MARFRIKQTDTIKAKIFNKEGKLLATLYDSGFTKINQVRETLKNKVIGNPKNTRISIYKEDTNEYWSEL